MNVGVRPNYKILQESRKTEHLVGLSVRTGALVHELQKERGLSSGFINAKGEKFKDELAKQRQTSDEQFKLLDAYKAANPDAVTTVKASLDASYQQRAKLAEIRSKIDGLSIEGKDSFAYYTSINYSYLNVVAAVGRNSRNPELMRVAIAYFDFSKAKEEMGKERATLNAVLANNAFNPETYQRSFAILAAQKSFMEGFHRFGSETAVAAYDQQESTDTFKKVEELRTTVVSKGMEGNFGIAPEDWFKAITAKIDLMKTTEDNLAKEILQLADIVAGAARTKLIASITATLIMAVLTLLLSLMIVSSITSPLDSLVTNA